MKLYNWILIAALSGTAWGEVEDAEPKGRDIPADDPFASDSGLGGGLDGKMSISEQRKDRKTRTVLLRTEIYEIDSLEAVFLVDKYEEDFAGLRSELLKRAREEKANLVDTCAVMTDVGLSAIVEGITETTYPTEYEPPETGLLRVNLEENALEDEPASKETYLQKFLQDVAGKATPTAFETRNTGITNSFEIRGVSSEKEVFDIQWNPEIVELVGEVKWQFETLTMPVFRSTRLNNSFRISENQWVLSGVSAVGQKGGGVDVARKRLYFVCAKSVR